MRSSILSSIISFPPHHSSTSPSHAQSVSHSHPTWGPSSNAAEGLHNMFYAYFLHNSTGKSALWVLRDYFDDIVDKDTLDSVRMFPSVYDDNDINNTRDADFLHNKMKNSKSIILLLTKDILLDPLCINDIIYAIDSKIPIVPVIVEDDDFHIRDLEFIVTHLDKQLDQKAIDLIKKDGSNMIDIAYKISTSLMAYAIRRFSLKDSKRIRIAQIDVIKDAVSVAKLSSSTISKDDWLARRNSMPISRSSTPLNYSTGPTVAAATIATNPTTNGNSNHGTNTTTTAATTVPVPAPAPASPANTSHKQAPTTPTTTTHKTFGGIFSSHTTTATSTATPVSKPAVAPRTTDKVALEISNVTGQLEKAIASKNKDQVVACCDYIFEHTGGEVNKAEDDAARQSLTTDGALDICFLGLHSLTGAANASATVGLLKVIRNLARNKDNKPLIVNKAEELIHTINSNRTDPLVQQFGFSILLNLFLVEANKDTIMKYNVISTVVEGMKSNVSKIDVQKSGCAVFWSLATSPERKVALVKGSAGKAIVDAMKSHKGSPDVQKNGCGALLQLVTASENIPELKALHVREAVNEAMKENPGNADIQRYGSSIISKVS